MDCSAWKRVESISTSLAEEGACDRSLVLSLVSTQLFSSVSELNQQLHQFCPPPPPRDLVHPGMGSWSCGLCCCCGVCEHSRLAAPVLFLVLGCADTCPGECAGSFQLVPCGSWPQDYLMKGSLLDSRS